MSTLRDTHDGPLVELVARLHKGTTLRERVVALRWRRRRPAGSESDASGALNTTTEQEHPVSVANLGDGGGDDNNNQQEVGGE